MDIDKTISHIEREIQASKFRIKELQQKDWQQFDKPVSTRVDFAPIIEAEKNKLDQKRQSVAKLYSKKYNL